MNTGEKFDYLKRILKETKKAAVAFSGGVDSSFLLYTAHSILGDGLLAVTVCSELMPQQDIKNTQEFAGRYGIWHVKINVNIDSICGFRPNTPDRCFLCKRHIMKEVISAAKKYGITRVVEGSNTDDRSDFRPGQKALEELGVESPLIRAGLTKAEIRRVSAALGLETHDRPAQACLASRIPYGEEITREKLKVIEDAEQYLRKQGFTQVRVRHHQSIARIEVLPRQMEILFRDGVMQKVDATLRQLGFNYVTLDLGGYRTGSLNESL